MYNGRTALSDDILKLSDSFKAPTDVPHLELITKVIDINYDKLLGTELSQCRTLKEYAFLIDKVRENHGDMEKAVKDCIKENVLVHYLEYYGSEVVNMLFEEYDVDKARKVLIEETREGVLKEGQASMIKRLHDLGNTVKQIASMFKMPESEVEKYLAMS